jgi:hypothetical protein
MRLLLSTTLILFLSLQCVFAGNPDRQGEAGAYELLMNPWARSAGLHTLSTSMVQGVESMRLNIAGLPRISNTEIKLSNAQYLAGTGVTMNALGIAKRMGKDNNSAFGISLMALGMGDIDVTVVNHPEGTGATFTPAFFHLGLGYAHMFENKVSVGILLRAVSESISDVNAFGLGVDAGVQYVTGERDNFKFGISIRNVGTPMKFGGPGMSIQNSSTNESVDYPLTYDQRANSFELPSLLNIGLSYDFYLRDAMRLSTLGNFTSNSFSRDQVGVGIEFGLKEQFMLRAAYKYELGEVLEGQANIYTGLSVGASIVFNLKKGEVNGLMLDYAYRMTNPFSGTHNISLGYKF